MIHIILKSVLCSPNFLHMNESTMCCTALELRINTQEMASLNTSYRIVIERLFNNLDELVLSHFNIFFN
jgi:hypothetical protein